MVNERGAEGAIEEIEEVDTEQHPQGEAGIAR